MLKAKGINAGYGPVQILFDFDLDIEKGEKLAIIGPNGSGKSTLLKTFMGLTKFVSGVIEFDGKDITNLQPYQRARLGISYLPQVGSTFEKLTIKENLRMAGYTLHKSDRAERIEEILEIFPILKDYIDKSVETLSGGMRQMLSTGISLMRKPKLMMFDEPTSNLAPNIAEEVINKILEIKEKSGITIIIVEQNTRMVLEICEKVCLIISGRIRYIGDSKKLLEHPRFGQIFLGIENT